MRTLPKGSFKKYVTPEGGGVDEVSHTLFIIFKILFLMFLEEKLDVTKQDTASKDTFFMINLIFQSNIGLIISH